MRFLALDVGDRRIGVAISDPEEILATGLTVVQRRGIVADVKAIAEVIREFDVQRIVVGLPRLMDGRLGEQAEKVKAFTDQLSQRIDIPIELWDERLSTITARGALIEAGLKSRKRKARIDAVAAAIILQSFLDSRRASIPGSKD